MGFISEYKQSQLLIKDHFDIIFFSESRNYHIYFEPLFQQLLLRSDLKICYITSDKDDPILYNKNGNFKAYYVKWMLGYVFSKLMANVMIMTMPDLDNFLLKRSPDVKKYIYLFHAAVSTHQQYKKEAFFHYDAIFCTGKYQRDELKAMESLYKLQSRDLIAYGYPLFQLLKEKSKKKISISGAKIILIAPSWYEQCILNTCIIEIVEELKFTGYDLIIRSHPEYMKRNKKSYLQLKKKMAGNNNIYFDEDPNVINSLLKADVLITDRSGIALEFAFGMDTPVLFIDTPPKLTNISMHEVQFEPLENKIRTSIGLCLKPDEIEKIKDTLIQLGNLHLEFSHQIKEMGNDLFFNAAGSFQNGIEYILSNCFKKN